MDIKIPQNVENAWELRTRSDDLNEYFVDYDQEVDSIRGATNSKWR